MEERIYYKLKSNLTIIKLEVTNQSFLHAGHIEDNGSNESHFEIKISAEELQGKSKVEAHRIINELLKEEFIKNGLHALAIKVGN